MLESEAKYKLCPFGATEGYGAECRSYNCMAWRRLPLMTEQEFKNRIDELQSKTACTREDAIEEIYKTGSTTEYHGYCKLVEGNR